MSLTPNQETLRKRFNTDLDPSLYHTGWDSLLRASPETFAASVSLASVPRKKRHLSAKNQALISLAVSANATHLYAPGIRTHTRHALSLGATPDEIVEVLELSSTLGIHACNIGVPLLVEVMREAGMEVKKGTEGFDEERLALKEDFTRKRGYWHSFWEDFLRLDKEFFAAYLEFSSVPWTKGAEEGKTGGVLEPKLKELVYCAFDTAATHLYQPGLKLHMKNVLGLGGTPEEIMEVLELATFLSVHTLFEGLPVLEEEVKKMQEQGKS